MQLVYIILLVTCCANAIEFSYRPRLFSLEIVYHTQKELDGHAVISPFGIWSLMTAVQSGAGGRSETQLMRALRLPKSKLTIWYSYRNLTETVLNAEPEGVNLDSSNFMFFDEECAIDQDFQENVERYFNTKAVNLPFDSSTLAAEAANNFIRRSGSTKLNVLNPGDFFQKGFIVTNVVNFRGLWKSPFDELHTKVEPFYDENGVIIGGAKMMYKKDSVPFSRIEPLESLVAELPYGIDNKFCMLLILPDPKVKVADAYKNLIKVSIREIFDTLQKDVDDHGLRDVEIKLPRFKISTNVVLNKPFMHVGVFDIFNVSSANFKRITDKSIYVSAIIHNANIEVTEAGTTVASTVKSLQLSSRNSLERELVANRPFIYFITEKPTATIVFGGIYSKPSVF